MKWFFLAATLACAVLVSACGPEPVPLPDATFEARTAFAQAGIEHRPSIELHAGAYARRVTVGSAESVLRIGVLPSGEEEVSVRVERDGERVADQAHSGADAWFDLSLPVSGGEYEVTIESADSFYLSHCEAAEAAPGAPNVLMFLVDTLRPDRLSCYGYERETTPNIDAMAAEAVRFTTAIAQSTWTRPTAASILTSTYPGVHGAEDRPDVLRSGLPSMAEALRAAGYWTIGIVSNVNLQTRWGFGSDFDRYRDLTSDTSMDEITADRHVIKDAIAAIDDAGARPWFLYAHLMAPHGPYDPPPEFEDAFPPELEGLEQWGQIAQVIRSQYDGEIAFADSLFGKLINALKERGAYDNTVIVFVSDHGEQFHEHGFGGHGFTVFDEEMRVPLIIKLAGARAGVKTVDAVVEQVDIAPTVLELAGAPAEPRFSGVSLAGLMNGGDAPERLSFTQLRLGAVDMRAVRSKKYKYVFDAATQKETFFNLETDPAEKSPLDEPTPAMEALVAHSNRRATSDASGFHFLITDEEGSNRTISVEIEVPGIRDYLLQSPGGAIAASREGDTIRLEGRMKHPEAVRNQLWVWKQSTKLTNYVHLLVDAPVRLDEAIRVTYQTDGASLPAIPVHAGEHANAVPLDGSPLRAADLIAAPDRYALPTLDPEPNVYLWYVPPVETIADQALPADVLEDLEALGYVR